MKLRRFSADGVSCGWNENCEGAYLSEDGRIFIQGTTATSLVSEQGSLVDGSPVAVATHETVIEISPALLRALKRL